MFQRLLYLAQRMLSARGPVTLNFLLFVLCAYASLLPVFFWRFHPTLTFISSSELVGDPLQEMAWAYLHVPFEYCAVVIYDSQSAVLRRSTL